MIPPGATRVRLRESVAPPVIVLLMAIVCAPPPVASSLSVLAVIPVKSSADVSVIASVA